MTRINDFAAGPSVNLSELKTHPREEGGQGGQESRGKTLAEVQKALLDFEREEHQIPTSVLLMANFKKGLFRGKFLPVLMSLPKTKTTRLFMENLLQKEKISKKLYENYMGS